jgi:NADPH:quinone reductase-like Zn-dependent oxidoreductase
MMMGSAVSLPTDMQALVATSASTKALENFPTPKLGDLHKKFDQLPDSCEVLVNVASSSVNPADMHISAPTPQVMGSDIAGTIVAVQDSCKRLKVGDKVWGDIGAVTHYGSKKGKENGGYAPVAVALESQLGIVPQGISFDEAASLAKVSLTSYKALVWYGGAPYTPSNGTVLILGGSGGTGTAGIQLAKAYGAKKVITTTSASNFDYVKALGATEAIDYHSQNWYDVVDDGTVDVIYDCVGQSGTGDKAMPKLRSGGFYVTLRGALPSKARSDVSSNAFTNSDTNLDSAAYLDALSTFIQSNQLRMSRLRSYPLASILDAFNESSAGHVVGKVVIEMPSLSKASSYEKFEKLMNGKSLGSCNCFNTCLSKTIADCCKCSSDCANDHDLQVECQNDSDCAASGACPVPTNIIV